MTKHQDLKKRKLKLASFGWTENKNEPPKCGHYWTHENVSEKCTLRQAEEIQRGFERSNATENTEEINGLKARVSSLERMVFNIKDKLND